MSEAVEREPGWKLSFGAFELHEADVLCGHLWLVTQVVGDSWDLDPIGSPARLMSWVAAMISIAAPMDFDVARGMVAVARAEDLLAAYTPKG